MGKGSYYFRLGAFECWAIKEGSLLSTADFAFANAPPDALEEALRNHGLRRDMMKVSLNSSFTSTTMGLFRKTYRELAAAS